MSIENQNFFDFFGAGDGTGRSRYSNSKKIGYYANLAMDGVVPSPKGLSDPSSSLSGPTTTHKFKRIGEMDAGDVALIIAGIAILVFITWYFWSLERDKKEAEIKQKEFRNTL